MKYKIQFESKGKSLVSGHHIAFDYMPKVDSLLVGTRVVVKHQTEEGQFCPGTLAELPSRKNRMRFVCNGIPSRIKLNLYLSYTISHISQVFFFHR